MKHLWDRRNYIIMVLAVFFVNYSLDRITKIIAVKYLKDHVSLHFWNNLFILQYAENIGAFLSLGNNWNIYVKYIGLLIIPIIICIVALVYLIVKETKMYRIIIGTCIIGGGIGNLVDRLFNNFAVVDFMNFGIGNIRTGILNVADMSVVFGMIALIIFEMINEKRQKKIKEEINV